MVTGQPGAAPTAARILDTAEQLVQVRGFNAFSYADVSAELGVTKAALHYHFPSKAALGKALIARYSTRFAEALAEVDREVHDAPEKLRRYARLYLAALQNQRMCLCGMLAAEYNTLPSAIQVSVIRFFDENEAWLAGVLKQGRTDGTLRFPGSPRDTARVIIGGLEGAMLVARTYGDPDRFRTAAANLLAGLQPANGQVGRKLRDAPGRRTGGTGKR